MQKKPVIVFTEKESEELYSNFLLESERVHVHPLQECRKFLGSFDADALLLDCGFNSNRGLEFLQEIKHLFPTIPIIFLTSMSSENTAIEAFRRGAIDYFRKPVNLVELRDTVVNLLRTKRGNRETRTSFKTFRKDDPSPLVTTNFPVNIIRSIRYIEDHLSDTIHLETLANEASISKYHFCRIFKSYTGMGAKRFVATMRLKKARKLIELHDDINISMVAAEVGFNSTSNFIKCFKKQNGVTPYTYKRSLRNKESLPAETSSS